MTDFELALNLSLTIWTEIGQTLLTFYLRTIEALKINYTVLPLVNVPPHVYIETSNGSIDPLSFLRLRKPPEIKDLELLRRMKLKEEALRKYEKALKEGDYEAARKYAQRACRLTSDMVKDAQQLLDLLGIPWVQAPSEGEAQAAYMAMKGDVWAAASQDYDSLLYGAPRLARNVTISGRRKLPRKPVYVEVKPEIVELEKVLNELGITREQLVDIGILVGTDYNPQGVKGIGPKTALKLIKEHGSLEKALREIKNAEFPVPPEKIREVFLNPKVKELYV